MAIVPIDFTWQTPRSLAEVRGFVTTSVARVLRAYGYRVQAQDDWQLVMVRPRSANWPMLLVSALVFLLSDRGPYRAGLDISVLPDGLTQLHVTGHVPNSLARTLLALPGTDQVI